MRSTVTLVMCIAWLPAWAADLAHSSEQDPGFDPVHKSQELRRKGDYKEAERVLRDAIAQPVESRIRAVFLNNLADLLREQDRQMESRKLFDQAMKEPGITWDQQFASYLGLADLARQEENWDQSLAELTQAADMARAHNDQLLLAFADRGLGETWLDEGNCSRAEPLLKRALAVLDNNPRVPRERLAVALDTIATLYRVENKTALAEEAWMRELDIHRTLFGEYHPQTAMVMGRLAELWSFEGDFDRAESWSRQSVSVMKGLFGDKSLPFGSALVNAGLVEQRAKHLSEAADMYSGALGVLRENSAKPDAIKVVSELYARVLNQMHRSKEAKQVMGQIQSFHSK